MEPKLKNPRCRVSEAMSVIGGKWKIPIIFNLSQGTHRFGELRKALGTVTQQMLSKQLKELEAYNLVNRKVYPEVPLRVEYSLTERGLSVLPVIHTIHNWATEELVSSEVPVD